MQIVGTTIIFKSDPGCYEKEKCGKKPNTVRQIPQGDEWVRFQDVIRELQNIIIVNSDTGERFQRRLTDIHDHRIKAMGRDDIETWIFSWMPYAILDH